MCIVTFIPFLVYYILWSHVLIVLFNVLLESAQILWWGCYKNLCIRVVLQEVLIVLKWIVFQAWLLNTRECVYIYNRIVWSGDYVPFTVIHLHLTNKAMRLVRLVVGLLDHVYCTIPYYVKKKSFAFLHFMENKKSSSSKF